MPQQGRRVRHDAARTPAEDGGAVNSGIDFFAGGFSCLAGDQPLAELEACVPKIPVKRLGKLLLSSAFFGGGDHVITPFFHRRVLFPQNVCVAGNLIHTPRNDAGGVAPSRLPQGAVAVIQQLMDLPLHRIGTGIGNHHRYSTVCVLVAAQTAKPPGQQGRCIGVEH